MRLTLIDFPMHSISIPSATRSIAAGLTLALGSQLLAQAPSEAVATNGDSADTEVLRLEPLSVIGSRENLESLPGAGAFIDATEFRQTGNLTFNRITAKIPGVYVREEDGYGNFITVSIRGVDSNRSNKVTLMEDGILSSPSPYSAPAAYYSPKLGRMSGIEILKGSSQIAYGPHTTGGVINFLSTPVPASSEFYSRTTFGTDRTLYNHTTYGDTVELSGGGSAGYLVELQSQRTDGFRKIDGTSRDSGFTLVEPMVKLFWEPGTDLAQRFEFKAGYTSFDANESYSGLAEADLRANPDRRYAASQFDELTSDQWRSYLKYIVQPSDSFRIESALYYNRFERSWDKLDGLNGGGLRTNVAQALLHAPSLAVLQGLGAGNIFTREAYRNHDAMGWQTTATHEFETGEIDHRFNVGLRVHRDNAAGSNQRKLYASDLAGGFTPLAPDPVQNAGTQEVTATALFAEHAVTIGKLTVTPGVRVEFLDWSNLAYSYANASAALPTTVTRTSGDESFYTGGVGFTYEASQRNTLFGGVHRGASVPNPASYSRGADEETSLALELGLRHRREALRGELVAFHTTFEDLLAPQLAVGGGGLAPTSNGGGAEVYGLESLIEYDIGQANSLGHGLPVYLSATWTSAQFTDIPNRLANDAGLFAGARNGNDIPYVPEWKLAAGAAYVAQKWTARIDVSYVTKTWGTGYNGEVRVENDGVTPSNPTAVDGRIDSLFLVDLTGHYDVNEHLRLVGGVQNVFDERGITSRAPLGPRANAPRFVFAGAEVRF